MDKDVHFQIFSMENLFGKLHDFVPDSEPIESQKLLPETILGRHWCKSTRFSGWRFGILLACISIAICLLVEVVFLTVAVSTDAPVGGYGTLFEGNCARARYLNVALLVPFNIIGTGLIAASNYVMQCLNSPTREEVDKVHSSGHYLNVGRLSTQNLRRSSRWKLIVWWVLGLSTIPIHLLLNSTIFATLQTNNYGVLVAGSNFLEDSTWDACSSFGGSSAAGFACALRHQAQTVTDWNSNTSKRLDSGSCITQFGNSLQSEALNVILVAKDETVQPWPSHSSNLPRYGKVNHTCSWDQNWDNSTQDLLIDSDSSLFKISSVGSLWNAFDYGFWAIGDEVNYNCSDQKTLQRANQWQPNTWLCDGDFLRSNTCSQSAALQNMTNWKVTPKSIEIDHCLVFYQEEKCTIQYSLTIFLIIIGCDTLKLVVIACVLRNAIRIPRDSDAQILATLGDAISSFLQRPDENTRQRCLVDQWTNRVLDNSLESRLSTTSKALQGMTADQRATKYAAEFGPQPQVWQPRKLRWFHVPPRFHWSMFSIGFCTLIGATIGILVPCWVALSKVGLANIWAQGLGTINPNAIFPISGLSSDSDRSLLGAVVLINTPQMLFSMLYYLYNSLFTSMWIGREWGQFAQGLKTLRVTDPRGEQRSTYWLSLPWKVSMPLVVISGLLQWFVSRGLFLVKLDVIGWDGKMQSGRNYSGCGYSALPLLFVAIILSVMLVGIAFAARTPLEKGITLAGTSTKAISANCHYIEGHREDVALKPVMWGVIFEGDGKRPGHCSFTNTRVKKPVEGHLYA